MRLLSVLFCVLSLVGCRYDGRGIAMKGIDIWKAVENEQLDLIRQYVAEGGDLEIGRRMKGKTPLFHAMDLEKRESFEELLRLGASPNTICRRGGTVTCPLHWAAMAEDPYWLERLLENGGDVDLKLIRGNVFDLPMSFAVSSSASLENVKLLVEHGADVNAVVQSPDFTAVSRAANTRNTDKWWKVLYLLEQGADYEKGGYSHRVRSSLMQTMEEHVRLRSIAMREPGFQDVLQWLKDHGADPAQARWDGAKWVYDLKP